MEFNFTDGKIHLYTSSAKTTEITRAVGGVTFPFNLTMNSAQINGTVDVPAGTVLNLNGTGGAPLTVYYANGGSLVTTLDAGGGGDANFTAPVGGLSGVARIEYGGANSSGADYTFPNITYSALAAAGKINNLVGRGSTITLAASATVAVNGNIDMVGSRFVNNAGTSALTPGALKYWRVWSTNADPYNATTGDAVGLNYSFKQYNATYGTTTPAESGSGYLLSYAPTATVGLTGSITRAYDGTRTANLATGNFTISGGAVGNDQVTLNTGTLPGSGLFDTKDVGTNKTVTANTSAVTVSATETVGGSSVNVYGYGVGNSATGTGAITKAALGVSVTGTYNGTQTFTTAGGATIATNGLVNGETLTGVSIDNANVSANGANFISGFTAGTASLGNQSIQNGYNASTSGGSITRRPASSRSPRSPTSRLSR